ncbi:MAG: TSCPD domain-containing protein [Desulfatirhabdiaceae bacterium]
MTPNSSQQRFIYKTDGVCPPEIHFQIHDGILDHIRFVGGGCPGNARLVERLITGRPIEEILEIVRGISCRNGTSCPDQLALAIQSALAGHLTPADSFRLFTDASPRYRVAFVGDLGGNPSALRKIHEHILKVGVDAVYCIGNITGHSHENRQTIQLVRELKIQPLLGETDWAYVQGNISGQLPTLSHQAMDWLLQFPQMLNFRLGEFMAIAFYGDYLQHLPGFSDYEPYALEMNMVCGLTDFMRDETVFPALSAMTPQFQADIVLFGQTGQWGHWCVGGKNIISLGPAAEHNNIAWGLLTVDVDALRFRKMPIDPS